MNCPDLDCQEALRFEDLPEKAREHFLNNREQYQM
jgi:hypothetical protein